MIRSSDKVLQDFITPPNMTLYTNAKGVHGGCAGTKGYCGWFYTLQSFYFWLSFLNEEPIFCCDVKDADEDVQRFFLFELFLDVLEFYFSVEFMSRSYPFLQLFYRKSCFFEFDRSYFASDVLGKVVDLGGQVDLICFEEIKCVWFSWTMFRV